MRAMLCGSPIGGFHQERSFASSSPVVLFPVFLLLSITDLPTAYIAGTKCVRDATAIFCRRGGSSGDGG